MNILDLSNSHGDSFGYPVQLADMRRSVVSGNLFYSHYSPAVLQLVPENYPSKDFPSKISLQGRFEDFPSRTLQGSFNNLEGTYILVNQSNTRYLLIEHPYPSAAVLTFLCGLHCHQFLL